jgi:hypothetical protein
MTVHAKFPVGLGESPHGLTPFFRKLQTATHYESFPTLPINARDT